MHIVYDSKHYSVADFRAGVDSTKPDSLAELQIGRGRPCLGF